MDVQTRVVARPLAAALAVGALAAALLSGHGPGADRGSGVGASAAGSDDAPAYVAVKPSTGKGKPSTDTGKGSRGNGRRVR